MSLSEVVINIKKIGIEPDSAIDHFLIKALFSTLTNVNFDNNRLISLVKKTIKYRNTLISKIPVSEDIIDIKKNLISFKLLSNLDELIIQGNNVELKSYPADNNDILSLKHTVLFGIKGISTYADHAQILGYKDPTIFNYIYKTLSNIQKKI